MRDYKTISIDVENARGAVLSAKLEMPADEKPVGFAIFSNCFTCEKEFFAPKRVSRALAAKGIATARFDFTGLGKSSGKFSDTNFTTNIDDILTIAQKIKADYDADIGLLIGHSFGGAASIGAASQFPHLQAVATIGSPKDPRHVMRHFEQNAQILERDGMVEITVAGRVYVLKKQFAQDVKMHDIEADTRNLKSALFVFHDPEDDMVAWENAEDLFERGPETKFLVTLNDAGHMLSNLVDAEYVANILSSYIKNGKKPSGENIRAA